MKFYIFVLFGISCSFSNIAYKSEEQSYLLQLFSAFEQELSVLTWPLKPWFTILKKSTDPFILPIPGIFQVTEVTQNYGKAYIIKWLWLWVILPQAAKIKAKTGEAWKYQQIGSDLKKQPWPGSFFCPCGPETNQPTPLRCWQPGGISKKGPNTSTWPRKPLCSHRLETPSSPHWEA